MRKVLPLALLLSVVLAAAPAHADTGVAVGPARQYVSPTTTEVTIQVANVGDTRMTLHSDVMAYNGESWEPTRLGLKVRPASFTLAPRTQRAVTVAIPAATTVPCRLVGVRFWIPQPGAQGLVLEGGALAQLALGGRGYVESDCLAVLPEPPPASAPESASGGFWADLTAAAWRYWPWAVGLLSVLWIVLILKRRHEDKEQERKRQRQWR